jgi:hypothetical protein
VILDETASPDSAIVATQPAASLACSFIVVEPFLSPFSFADFRDFHEEFP